MRNIPYRSPTAAPEATAASMASAIGCPSRTMSTAITADANPERVPTDRSISPSSSTSTMPSAISPTGAANRAMLTTLYDDRNRGSSR